MPKIVSANPAPRERLWELLQDVPGFKRRLGIEWWEESDFKEHEIGFGFYARAYELPNGLVLKLTLDPDDAGASEILRREGDVPGLVHVHEVTRVPGEAINTRFKGSDRTWPVFAIVSERVEPVRKMDNQAYLFATSALIVMASLEPAADPDRALKHVVKQVSIGGYPGAVEQAEAARPYLDALVHGWRWLAEHGYRVSDVSYDNVGATERGPVLFDFGNSSLVYGAPRIDMELALAQNAGKSFSAKKVFESLGRPSVVPSMEALRRGIEVEMEHTSDPVQAGRIALDHFREFPDYYERLAVMEERAKKGLAPNLSSLPRARASFDKHFTIVEKKFPDIGTVELRRDEKAGRSNGVGEHRQFAYCVDGDPIHIAFASKVENLPEENIHGLMAHEWGHALDYRYGKKGLEDALGKRLPEGVERRADAIAEAVFGKAIRYDADDVQCVSCRGASPRPRRLGP